MDENTLIQSIDKLYFENQENFNLNHLTDSLPTNLTSEYLVEYKTRLERILAVVTRKVSELILSHQPTYVDELQRIADLQKSITESIRVCTQGRSCLRFIKDGTAKNGSTILEHYRKRKSLAKLLDSLNAISDLRNSVFEIRSLIENQEDFPKAIQMCRDGKSLLVSFQKYKCVNELGQKLNDTIELIGEQVDTVLSKMCLSYDSDIYAKLQRSYILMDRSEIAVDQLLMHFCSAINSEAHNVVIKYITIEGNSKSSFDGGNGAASQENINEHSQNLNPKLKRDFQELCKMLSSEQYLHCLVELCTKYWFIMLNYKRILCWHEVDLIDETQNDSIEGNKEIPNDDIPQNNREQFKRQYVEQKLIGGLNRLWYDVKRKLSILILNHDFSTYRFDEFIKILSVVDLVMRIGNEFCGFLSSEDLRECLNAQALNFFNAYHKSSMEELKMFLENEVWEIVPVKNDFKLVQLKEFSFLRSLNLRQEVKLTTYQTSPHTNEPEFFTQDIVDDQDINLDKIQTINAQGSPSSSQSVIPFDKVLQVTKETTEDLFAAEPCGLFLDQQDPLPLDKISLSTDSEDDLDSELNKDFVEEDEFISSEDEDPNRAHGETAATSSMIESTNTTGSRGRYLLTKTSGPVLTNSSLNVLRLFGRYIQMMSVLEPISYQILMKIYNLLDHYTMVVYKKFGPDSDKKSDDKNISPKLKVVIRSIRESLIGNQSGIEDSNLQPNSGDSHLIVQQGVPNITDIITHDLTMNQTKANEHINPKKAVAVESLISLVNQLWNLQEYLESLISPNLRPQLREQFTQSHSIVPDFLKARAEISSNVTINCNE